MDFLYSIFDIFLHLDKHLTQVALDYGMWTYLILLLIIFCETGLVVTPFLPGDSLLFAAGALASKGALDPNFLMLILFSAAVVGDAVNYHIGNYIGPKVFEKKDSKIFKKEYLDRTQKFYDRYGGKTIIIARFIPIIRTFAPFLAGVASMSYPRFAVYNLIGALMWVGLFVYGGYFFGSLPFVEKNFKYVILAIIVISILPAVIEALRARTEARRQVA